MYSQETATDKNKGKKRKLRLIKMHKICAFDTLKKQINICTLPHLKKKTSKSNTKNNNS